MLPVSQTFHIYMFRSTFEWQGTPFSVLHSKHVKFYFIRIKAGRLKWLQVTRKLNAFAIGSQQINKYIASFQAFCCNDSIELAIGIKQEAKVKRKLQIVVYVTFKMCSWEIVWQNVYSTHSHTLAMESHVSSLYHIRWRMFSVWYECFWMFKWLCNWILIDFNKMPEPSIELIWIHFVPFLHFVNSESFFSSALETS